MEARERPSLTLNIDTLVASLRHQWSVFEHFELSHGRVYARARMRHSSPSPSPSPSSSSRCVRRVEPHTGCRTRSTRTRAGRTRGRARARGRGCARSGERQSTFRRATDGESVQGDVARDARDDETDDGGDERYEFDVVCDAVCGGAWTG